MFITITDRKHDGEIAALIVLRPSSVVSIQFDRTKYTFVLTEVRLELEIRKQMSIIDDFEENTQVFIVQGRM